MKNHVYQTPPEYKLIVIEAFRSMMESGTEFPIRAGVRANLKKNFYAAQQKVLPIERRVIYSGSEVQRKKFMNALNYRFIRYQESAGVAPVVMKEVPATPAVSATVSTVKKAMELGILLNAMGPVDVATKEAFVRSYMAA